MKVSSGFQQHLKRITLCSRKDSPSTTIVMSPATSAKILQQNIRIWHENCYKILSRMHMIQKSTASLSPFTLHPKNLLTKEMRV